MTPLARRLTLVWCVPLGREDTLQLGDVLVAEIADPCWASSLLDQAHPRCPRQYHQRLGSVADQEQRVVLAEPLVQAQFGVTATAEAITRDDRFLSAFSARHT